MKPNQTENAEPEQSNKRTLLAKKSSLIPVLLISIYVLNDDTNEQAAFVTALQTHRPSLRVFRGLSEICLLLFCAAFSLMIWNRALGREVVGDLLFRPACESGGDVVSVPDDEPDNEEAEEAEERVLEGSAEEEDDDRPPLPPSAASIANAAVDFLLLILVCLFFFTLSSTTAFSDRESGPPSAWSLSAIAAPVFPLVLFFIACSSAFLPWNKRKPFWKVLSRTIEAPFYDVTFRDGFIGDILTSSVRPLQDLCFTLFYLLSGLQGWWSSQYSLDEAAAPVERSWLVHAVLLPACMVSPLWCRFLQNLRQAYDSKKRWPHLGNAFKYFIAAEVALFGIFVPGNKENVVWILSFGMATLYQVWWDVFMDWELLEYCPSKRMVVLRQTRLYFSESLYWSIFVVNFLLRFCWTLSFIPPQTLSRAGLFVDTFSGDFKVNVNTALASAEIVRRMLWGLLRVELEAIKRADASAAVVDNPDADECPLDDDIRNMMSMELEPMSVECSERESFGMQRFSSVGGGVIFGNFLILQSDMSASSGVLILGELCLYATAFMSLGIIAAAHRQ